MMKKLGWMVACVGLLSWASLAWSQSPSYPTRPVRLIVPFPPTGAVDPIGRMIAHKLTEAWGQPVLVDNKPGAGTIVGTEIVAKAAPDGYTVVLAPIALSVNQAMHTRLPYDPVKDFTPLSLVLRSYMMVAVSPQLPVKSIQELIAFLKTKPGQINFASTGNGTIQHLAGELFKSMAGVDMVHVPFKGSGPAMMSVMSGEVSVNIDVIALLLPQAKAGKLRALAVTATNRSPLAPDLPTVSESGLPGFDVSGWLGLLGPAKLPRPIVEKWHREVSRMVQLPEIRELFFKQGQEPVGSTPDYFAEHIKSEITKWGNVVKQSGIKVD